MIPTDNVKDAQYVIPNQDYTDLHRRILRLLALDYTLPMIADDLGYHVNSIRYHIAHMRKLYGWPTGRIANLPSQAVASGVMMTRKDCEVVKAFTAYAKGRISRECIFGHTLYVWLSVMEDEYDQRQIELDNCADNV